MNKLRLVEQVTALVNSKVPPCAVDLRINTDNIEYLHPTKGWKRVAFRRFGVKAYAA